jgi:hypothetical protein
MSVYDLYEIMKEYYKDDYEALDALMYISASIKNNPNKLIWEINDFIGKMKLANP